MPRIQIPIVGPSYEGESPAFDAQRSINLYPRVSESGNSKAVSALLGAPGLNGYVTLPQSPIRGRRVADGRLFVIAGSGLYEVTGAGASTLRGSIGTTTGNCGMTDDGDELVFGDGSTFWVYNLSSNTLAALNGAPAGTHCDVIDSVIVCVEAGTGKLWYTEPTIADEIDGLNFVTAESAPDDLVAVLVDHGEILAIGEKTIETLTYTGGSDNAIERVNQAVIEYGCAAAFSVQKIDNSFLWISKGDLGQGIVRRATGLAAQRVSTFPVEHWLSRSTNLAAATAWTYEDAGHSFYALSAPGLDSSWVLDLSNGQWHERAWLNPVTGLFERHRADGHVFWNGLHLVSDYATGVIYELSRDIHDDDGNPRRATRRTPHVHSDGRRMFYSRLWIDMEMGVGLDGSVQGSDPVVMLRWSDDGGRTWSNERQASIGRIGEFGIRAVFTRLGSARQRTFEVSVSDPVRLTIMNAWADVTVGVN